MIYFSHPNILFVDDCKFRNAYEQNGLLKLLWFALTQSYSLKYKPFRPFIWSDKGCIKANYGILIAPYVTLIIGTNCIYSYFL